MSKKLFKLTPIGALAGALSGKKKPKAAAPAAPTPEAKGPIVTPLGATPAALGDPRRRRPGSYSTILTGGLNGTLGG